MKFSERGGDRGSLPGVLRFLLAIPLTGKIAGANLLIGLAAVATFAAVNPSGATINMLGVFVIALAVALVINLVLISVALRPLRAIEDTVRRVTDGDIAARVPYSALSDSKIERIGSTLNTLLDVLSEDQNRIRKLAGRAILSSDEDRAAAARALHDSAAQSLAALAFQVGALTNETGDPVLQDRLRSLRVLAIAILEEVRLIGQTMYPQALENLGLGHALQGLARDISERNPDVKVNIAVDSDRAAGTLPHGIAAVLYQVANEGLSNAVRHSRAQEIEVQVAFDNGSAHLTVADDGRGFDVNAAERNGEGTGLFGIRQRLAQVGGEMKLTSRAGAGTRLSVTVPLTAAGAQQQ